MSIKILIAFILGFIVGIFTIVIYTLRHKKSKYPIIVEDNNIFKFEITDIEYNNKEYLCIHTNIKNKLFKYIVFHIKDISVNDNLLNVYLGRGCCPKGNFQEFLFIPWEIYNKFEHDPIEITINYSIIKSNKDDLRSKIDISPDYITPILDKGKFSFILNC